MPRRLTTDQASALRRHYARLADLYGERCVDALLDGRYRTAARWERAYCDAAGRCRVLGEQMRPGRTVTRAAVASSDAARDARRTELPALTASV